MGPLRFKNFYYEVLQLDISNFKSTGKQISSKDKTCQTWQCLTGQLALTGPSNYTMNSHIEFGITEKCKSQTYGITQTFKTLKYLSLMALLDLRWMAKLIY